MSQDTTNKNKKPQGHITIEIPAGASLNSTDEKPRLEHSEVLDNLIDQVEPIDFQKKAFPQAEQMAKEIEELEAHLKGPDGKMKTDKELDFQRKEWQDKTKELAKLKVTEKHLLVIAVETIIQLAIQKLWGLCKNLDFIYVYNGFYWADIDKEVFQKFLGEAAEKMGVGKFIARFYLFREKMFKQFIATAYLSAPKPNKDSVLVNLKNGTFEIGPNGTKLRPFQHEDFLTYQLPFHYDRTAKAPIFERYLEQVLPDKQSRDVLAEYLGYIFIRSSTLKLEKALLLYGTGANGKSVFFEVVSALLGPENVSNFTLQSLTDEAGYYRAKIANKLVNYASEINGKLEASLFKQLVSGEPVGARLPYGQPFTVTDYAKLIFNTNSLPADVEHTNAYFRRFLIIPFEQTIPEEKQDKELAKKIIENELSGVFNWVLTGLNRLLKNKRFSECKASEEARKQYEKESDSVRLFIEEDDYYVKSVEKFTTIKGLYFKYKGYCMEDGLKPVKKSNFIKRLKAAGVFIKRNNQGMIAYLVPAERNNSGDHEK